MNAPKKNKPAAPANKPSADPEATGFVIDQIRQALGCTPDDDVLDKARATVNHLALARTALDKSERLRDEDFRRLVGVLKQHGLPVGDAIDPTKIVELTEMALAGLNQRLDEACDILDIPKNKRGVDAMLTAIRELDAGLTRRINELHREIEDTRKILGIDDPDGLLLDENGMLMGDIGAASVLVKQTLQAHQYTVPPSLPDAIRALVRLAGEQSERMADALNNLALHTSAASLEDAAAEVSGKLEDAETRLENLENERLQALADDADAANPHEFAIGSMQITRIDEEDCSRIVRDLMRKIVDGQITLIHNI